MPEKESPKLPRFRKDLKIYSGPFDVDGSPTYNIYDPLKGSFYKISWKESLIFKSYTEELTADELAKKVARSFPIEISDEDVSHFFSQAYMLGLLRVPQEGQKIYDAKVKSRESWWSWFLMHYLFLRIPVFHPDKFLEKTLPYVKFLGSKWAFIIYGIFITLGFALLINRLDEFFHTFSYYFNIEGLLIYACVISLIKCFHELAHAYTAKNYGLYVPTMGIAFLVLWPVLYTDVTEGWKLQSRKKRFLISAAGIIAEFVMAGFATIGWIFSTPGMFQTLCFLVASTSWFTTIVINVNPAVRFDGYYILADLWGIDNLMSRAFSYARWQFHKTFFGIDLPCPEERISKKRASGFIIYTIYTITYRFFLYTAIALFVYFEFTKLLGIALFIAEIWIFFLMPVVWEASILYQMRSKIKYNFRTLATLLASCLLLGWFILPFPHSITFSAVVAPKEEQIIYAPENGKITSITAVNGQKIDSGSTLIQIESEDLKLEIARALQDHNLLQNELLSYTGKPESEGLISQKNAEIDQNEQLLHALAKREENLKVRATSSGNIVHWNPLLKPGQYVYQGQIFGSIADPNLIAVIAFVPEKDIGAFHQGQRAQVIFQSSGLHTIEATVENIEHKRVKELIYPALASIYGGPIAVTPHKSNQGEGGLLLHDSYFLVTLEVQKSDIKVDFGQSVDVKIRGPWRSYLVELGKYVFQAVFKELSF